MAPIVNNRFVLIRQRDAVERAMRRARASHDNEDAELLQTVVTLLEELHRINAFIAVKQPKVIN